MKDYCVEILVKLKDEIKDVKGETLTQVIFNSLGGKNLNCRCGNHYTIDFSAENDELAKSYVDKLASQILANDVIEIYDITWVK